MARRSSSRISKLFSTNNSSGMVQTALVIGVIVLFLCLCVSIYYYRKCRTECRTMESFGVVRLEDGSYKIKKDEYDKLSDKDKLIVRITLIRQKREAGKSDEEISDDLRDTIEPQYYNTNDDVSDACYGNPYVKGGGITKFKMPKQKKPYDPFYPNIEPKKWPNDYNFQRDGCNLDNPNLKFPDLLNMYNIGDLVLVNDSNKEGFYVKSSGQEDAYMAKIVGIRNGKVIVQKIDDETGKVLSGSKPISPASVKKIETVSNPTSVKKNETGSLQCKGTGAYAGMDGMDEWCMANCNHPQRNCPETHCKCT